MLKRTWLRFSLRKLIIFTAIACLYFACWIPTHTTGVDDVARRYAWKYNGNAAAKAAPVLPLLLSVTVHRGQRSGLSWTRTRENAYRFWFFGVMAEVPFTNKTVKPLAARKPAPISLIFRPPLAPVSPIYRPPTPRFPPLLPPSLPPPQPIS